MLNKFPPYGVVNTVSSVVTAFCLVVLTLVIVVGGAWTVRTVTELQSTYHPDKISGIINDLSDTVNLIHTLLQNTTHHHHLQSGHGVRHGSSGILEDLHQLSTGIGELSRALSTIPSLLSEAHEWRTMSTSAFGQLKQVMASL